MNHTRAIHTNTYICTYIQARPGASLICSARSQGAIKQAHRRTEGGLLKFSREERLFFLIKSLYINRNPPRTRKFKKKGGGGERKF